MLHQAAWCGHFSDFIWWGNHNCGIAKCQLFSQDIIDLEQEINRESILVRVSEGSSYRESTDSNFTLPVDQSGAKVKLLANTDLTPTIVRFCF